jgi:proline iminopeptidase
VLGHSWGAHLALRYALEHPERVSHLVYVSGTGVDADRGWHPYYERNRQARLGGLGPPPADEREWAIRQWSADFADPETALESAERLATPWFGINNECNRLVNDEVKGELGIVAARCRSLDVPVLIVDGSEDIRPRWAVDSLFEALPDAKRVTLAGAGHLPWVEARDEFARAVTRFLAGPFQ